MPDHLIQAAISSEDRKFYQHWGVNLPRFIYLAFLNVTHMEIVGGASTITQQLARKLYLSAEQTIIRKLREQLTAIQIERTYSKPEILEMYLNQMPLGRGTHGVQAAAQSYFGKNVEQALHGLLKRRNLCAHPTDYLPDLNMALGYLSEILHWFDVFEKKK